MTGLQAPPIYSPLYDVNPNTGGPINGKPSLPWTLFFNGVYTGDPGNAWSPQFTGLTETAPPTISGVYYRIGQSLVYFSVKIVPAAGGSTTSTAGTTFINNFPLQFNSDGACLAVSGLLGTNAGQIAGGTTDIYTPAWSAVTVPLTVVGIAEAS